MSETAKPGAFPAEALWGEGALDIIGERQEMQREMDSFLLALLPVLDEVEKLCRHIQHRPLDWVAARLEALDMLSEVAEQAALGAGLERTGDIGERAQAAKHHIVSVLASETQARGMIVEVLRPGWMYNGRVLRQALVIASSGPAEGETGGNCG